jgi:NitT/TauT family transport system permease protein
MTEVAVKPAPAAAVPVAQRRRGRARGRSWWSAVWPPVTAFLILLAIWEIAVRLSGVKPIILPPPSTIVIAMGQNPGQLLSSSWASLEEILIGLAASIVIGIPIAVLIASFKIFERAVYPLLVASQVIPKVALAPLFLIWFGFDLTPKVVLVFLISVFPIVINTAIGLGGIPIEKLYLARSMGAGSMTTLFRFRLPQALPEIFGGIKIATTLAVIGAVVGEFVSANAGLGYLIMLGNSHLNASLMFTAIVALTIIGVVLFVIVGIVERLVMPWHVSRRDSFNSAK